MREITMDLDLGMWLLYVDGVLVAADDVTDMVPPARLLAWGR